MKGNKMDNKDPQTIKIEMTAKDVAILSLMAELSLKFMYAVDIPLDVIRGFKKDSLPLLEQVMNKTQEIVNTNMKTDAINELKIRFGDKESPKDKPDAG